MRMDDGWLEPSQQQRECEQGAEIGQWPDLTHERGDLMKLDAGELPGVAIEQARFAGDQDRTESRGVEMRDREERILLRATELELGDDVADGLRHGLRRPQLFSELLALRDRILHGAMLPPAVSADGMNPPRLQFGQHGRQDAGPVPIEEHIGVADVT